MRIAPVPTSGLDDEGRKRHPRDNESRLGVLRVDAKEVEGRFLNIAEDIHVIGQTPPRSSCCGTVDFPLGSWTHSAMPSSACSGGVLSSATRNRSTSEPRNCHRASTRNACRLAYAKRMSPLASVVLEYVHLAVDAPLQRDLFRHSECRRDPCRDATARERTRMLGLRARWCKRRLRSATSDLVERSRERRRSACPHGTAKRAPGSTVLELAAADAVRVAPFGDSEQPQ